MIEKRDVLRYMLVGLITLTLISILMILRSPITGYAVYQDSIEGDFNGGSYINTEFNNTGIMLKYWNYSSLEMPDNNANGWIDMSGNQVYLRFNEYFKDVNENYIGVTSDNVTSVSGKFGNAADFSSEQSAILVKDHQSSYENITISFWYNIDSLNSGKWVGLSLISGIGFWIEELSYGAIQAKWYDASGSDSFKSTDIELNVWKHVVWKLEKYNTTHWNASLFIDGSRVANKLTDDGIGDVSSSPVLLIGNWHSFSDVGAINGKIDEVAVYDVAKSEDYIINTLYNSGTGYTHTGSETGLVSAFHFDEDVSSMYDYSGSLNSGYIDDQDECPTYKTLGKLNSAFEFDGVDDYVEISDTPALETANGTISLWFNPTNTYTSSNSDEAYFISKGNSYIGLGISDGSGDYSSAGAGTVFFHQYSSSGNVIKSTQNTWSENKWYHIVGSWDNSGMNLYIDGSEVDSNSYTEGWTDTDDDWGIGATDITTHNFKGAIDEVAIWNRSLSADEISTLYQRQKKNVGYGGGESGTYASQVFDAGNDAVWNNISWVSTMQGVELLYSVDGGGDIYKSEDSGTTWSLSKENYGRTTDGQYMFSDDNYMYILTNSNKEVYRSSDGETWTIVNDSFADSGILYGESDSNNNLFIADASGDVYKSIDSGVTWKLKGDFNAGSTNNAKGIAINSNDAIFVVDGAGDVYSSADVGVTWTKVNDAYGGGTGTNDMAVDENDYLYILLTNDVYKSTNNGVSWSKINDDFSPYSNEGQRMASDSNGDLYITDGVGRIFKSINEGIDWTELGDLNAGASNNPKGITFFTKLTTLDFQVKNCDDSVCSGEIWIDITDTSPQDLSLNNNQYFQYVVNFTSPDSSVTPSLESVSLNYDLVNTAPTILIAVPQSGASYGYNESLALDFSASDADDNIDSCWYNLNIGENIIIANCANTTIDVPEGSNTLVVYVNDTQGEQASDSVTFNVDVGAPTIVLHNPTDEYLNYQENIYFNYTPTDIDLDSCWLLGDFDGTFKINQTNTNPISGTTNSFTINSLNDNTYLWNIGCNDSQGNSATNGNKTLYIDIINPVVSISEPNGAKTSRTGIDLSFSVSDNNLDSCWYNVYRGDAIEVANSSANCSGSETFDVTVNADFVLNLFVNDSAGNSNQTNSSFSVDTSSIPVIPPATSDSSSGGGGGSSILPPTNRSGKVEVSEIGNLIAKPGDKKEIPFDAKNIGKYFLNNCVLSITGTIESWIYSDEIKGIAPGQIEDFTFSLNIPEEIEPGDYEGELELTCDKITDKQTIIISIPSELGLIQINEIKHEDNRLNISYTLDNNNLIGEKISIEIWILDEDEIEINRYIDEFELNQESPIQRNIIIEIPSKSIGIYSVYFAIASDLDNSVKQSIVLGKPKTTGLAIFDTARGKAISYGTFIIIIGIGLFFILRGHGKKVHKSENHWLLRKRKKLKRK